MNSNHEIRPVQSAIPRRTFVRSLLTAGTATALSPSLLRAAKPASGDKVKLA